MSASSSNGTTEPVQPAATWTIEAQEPPAEGVVEGLRACLEAYNKAEVGLTAQSRVMAWVARNAKGRMVGAMNAEARYGWLHVRLLWVNADQRGSGLGRALLRAAETRARELGLLGLLTDTASFQAPSFYLGAGFTVFGEVADLPPGHTTYYLIKRFPDT
jgi:GNAT superfamily N-acetyltransferase